MALSPPEPDARTGRRPLFGHVAGAVALAALTGGATRAGAAPPGLEPDRELIGLCQAFVALEDRIDGFYSDGATPVADDVARDAAAAPFHDRQKALLDSICAMPATTIAGLMARAAMMLRWAGEMADDPGPDGHWDARMVAALLRDFRDGAGRG